MRFLTPPEQEIIQRCRTKIHALHRRCTPFRLGYHIAYAREKISCPYPPGSRAEKSYLNGMGWGESDRAMDDAFFR